ncbi:hypothetical protein MMC25_006954, partial [Agyrium rufum]|nr:hypothetical protein [Agyrium rufum]
MSGSEPFNPSRRDQTSSPDRGSPQLKRKRKHSHDTSQVNASTTASKDWDKTTYRITKVPETFDLSRLTQAIRSLFELNVDGFQIHSLASDASDDTEPRWKVATISFRVRPAPLHSLLCTADGWGFDLPSSPAERDRMYFDTHFNGFTPLSPAERDHQYQIDCIFIHGWGGHAIGSFKSPSGLHLWPRDALPRHFPQLRVWTYGYESKLTEADSVADVYEYAETFRSLLRSLRWKRKTHKHSIPIIFMVHSLGGLIFKEAVIRMGSSKDPYDELNLRSIYGALFFGVPSQGMSVKAMASMIGGLPAQYTLNLLDQQRGHRLRIRQHEDFREAFSFSDSKIVSFSELKTSSTVIQDSKSHRWTRTGPRELLVSPASAASGRHWETGDDYNISLNGDHSSMIKFSENDRDGYEKVRHVVQDFTRNACPVIEARLQNASSTLEIPRKLTPDEQGCLQSLHFPEMDLRRKEISKPATSTCAWLSHHPTYLKWFKQHCGMLWVKGKPGAGKSTVLKHALSLAKEQEAEKSVIASFFFHGRGAEIQKSPLGLYRTLLHQILQQIPSLLTKLTTLFLKKCQTEGRHGEKWKWEERDLQDFCEAEIMNVARHCTIRIYVDALDECGEKTATDLVDFFDRITYMPGSSKASHNLGICFSCRHYPLIALENGLEVCVEDENSQDIEAFLNYSLGTRIRSMASIETIGHDILQKSQGSFQWAVLVVRQVFDLHRKGKNLMFIRRRIQQIPPDLDELYEDLLQGIDEEERPQSLHLMQWICFALWPPSLGMLRFALTIDADSTYSSIQQCHESEDFAENDDQMEKKIIHLSRGLAEVKVHEGGRVAQFIHQSVNDFFIEKGPQLFQLPSFPSMTCQSHFRLLRSCLRYLTLEEFQEATLSEGFLQDYRFPFLQYCVFHWILHSEKVEEEDFPQNELLPFLHGPFSILQRWNQIYEWIPRQPWDYFYAGSSILHVASRHNLLSLLHARLDLGIESDKQDAYGRSPLSWAAERGHEAVVKLLVERDDVEADSKDGSGQSPLSWAALIGHEAVVKLLVERDDVEADSKDDDGRSPLSWAASIGHEAVVKLLVERDDVEADSKD